MSVHEEGNFFKGLMWGMGLSIPLWTLIIWAATTIF